MALISKCPNCGRPSEDEGKAIIDQVFDLENHIKGFYGVDIEFAEDGSDTRECCTGCLGELLEPFMEGKGAAFTPAAA